MEFVQYQAAIEQALNFIQSQGPDAIGHLEQLLLALKAGLVSIAGVSMLLAKWPALVDGISQLVILINSGASIAEIAAQLGAWATTAGVSLDALLQLLYTLAGFMALF